MIDYNPIGTEILRWVIVGLVFGGWTVAVAMAARWLTMRTRKTDGEWKEKHDSIVAALYDEHAMVLLWKGRAEDAERLAEERGAKLKGIAALAATGGE